MENRSKRMVSSVCLALMMWAGGAVSPGAEPSAEAKSISSYSWWRDGVASKSPWLAPGKLDFLYKGRESDHLYDSSYNAFAWTPVFKGGGGYLDLEDRASTTYLGGFLRPLAGLSGKGDLILGAQGVNTTSRRDIEAQGEYRFPFGLGLGGGFAEAREAGIDVVFGKITWRQKAGRWNYILALLAQDVEGELSPGGYVALYDDQVMGVFGHDGEQWRVTGGYVAPTNRTILRPAAEAVYVDNSIGDFDGARSIFVNATLRLQGGFLAHPSRLGRAMGPQGLEFGNPLGFLFPTWNRRLETWEIGGLVDFRYERIWNSNGTTQDRWDGAVFPGQFFDAGPWLNPWFVGGSLTRTPTMDSPGLIGGWLGRLGFLNINLAAEHRFDPSETIVVAGLIDWF